MASQGGKDVNELKGSKFFKRLSFTKSGTASLPLDPSTLQEDDSQSTDEAFNAHEILRVLASSVQAERDDVSEMTSSVSTARKDRKKIPSLFGKKSKKGALATFSIADEFKR
jgi:hypothetical protein